MADKTYDIKKIPVDSAEKLMVDTKLWGYDNYNHKVYAQIVYDETGFIIKHTVEEKNPLAVHEAHFAPVNADSCVEFFVNFLPRETDRYINFEVNAKGYMNPSFRADRYDFVRLIPEEIEAFDIQTEILEDYWTVTYKIGFDFIKKYYKGFCIEECDYIIGNLQKCGDDTEIEHYLSYFPIECENPDFHRPEYFGKFNVIH